MEIKELESKIKSYIKAYDEGNPTITDEEYDALCNQLRKLDPENPLVHSGQSEFQSAEPKVKHKLVTGTLAKAENIDKFREWLDKQSTEAKLPGFKTGYVAMPKIDGSGLELIYKNGVLKQAITRGNGFEGIDRTDTVKFFVPNQLPTNLDLSVRGEAVIYKDNFESYFAKDYKNPRNCVAGLLNRKFEDLTTHEKEMLSHISFIAYDHYIYGDPSEGMASILYSLKSWSFDVPTNYVSVTDKERLVEVVNEMLAKTREWGFPCDGVVVRRDEIDFEDRKLRTPKNDIAVKPELQVAVTKVVDIEWSMSGKTLTPVAIVEPVELEGTTVQRANLCNLNNIKKLGIEIGSTVEIEKKGMIIPQITKVL